MAEGEKWGKMREVFVGPWIRKGNRTKGVARYTMIIELEQELKFETSQAWRKIGIKSIILRNILMICYSETKHIT